MKTTIIILFIFLKIHCTAQTCLELTGLPNFQKNPINRNCLTLGIGDAKFLINGSDNFLFTVGFFINHFDNFYIKYGADVFKLSYPENEVHYSLNVIPNLNFNFSKKKVDLFGGIGLTIHGAETTYQRNIEFGVITSLNINYKIYRKFGIGMEIQVPLYIYRYQSSPFVLASFTFVLM